MQAGNPVSLEKASLRDAIWLDAALEKFSPLQRIRSVLADLRIIAFGQIPFSNDFAREQAWNGLPSFAGQTGNADTPEAFILSPGESFAEWRKKQTPRKNKHKRK